MKWDIFDRIIINPQKKKKNIITVFELGIFFGHIKKAGLELVTRGFFRLPNMFRRLVGLVLVRYEK